MVEDALVPLYFAPTLAGGDDVRLNLPHTLGHNDRAFRAWRCCLDQAIRIEKSPLTNVSLQDLMFRVLANILIIAYTIANNEC